MPKAPLPCSPELREEAVRLVQSSGKRMSEMARDLGVSDEMLRTWVKRHQIDGGNAPGLTTAERDELREDARHPLDGTLA